MLINHKNEHFDCNDWTFINVTGLITGFEGHQKKKMKYHYMHNWLQREI